MSLKKFCEMSPEKKLFKICISTMISIDYITAKLQNLIFVFIIAPKLSHLIAPQILALSGEQCTTKIRTRNTGTRVHQMVARNFQFLSLRIYRLQLTIFLGMIVDFF
jgi:predicted membrane-bound spermidine synthase